PKQRAFSPPTDTALRIRAALSIRSAAQTRACLIQLSASVLQNTAAHEPGSAGSLRADQSGRAQPHPKPVGLVSAREIRQVFECGCALPLSIEFPNHARKFLGPEEATSLILSLGT